MSRSWARGTTPAWRKLRAQILARDGGRCQIELPDICTREATHVHHMRGKAFGDDPRWLIASCAACNLAVGAPNRAGNQPTPNPRSNW
jgi:5-methylcytosine-specific restriction endonuclease McrA